MTTKTYENMTVTVTCKENEDLEMMELIEKMNKTKAIRERTEEYYLPRIKAIGAAKWAEICKTSQATALRDINDLIEKGILIKGEEGSKNTNYILAL